MKTLNEQISDVIEQEPVAVFMKGTPQMVMCGNSHRALQALHAAGAPITTVDILPDPRIRQELADDLRLADDPAGLRQGRAHRRRGHHRGASRVGRAPAASSTRALGADRAQDVKVVALELA